METDTPKVLRKCRRKTDTYKFSLKLDFFVGDGASTLAKYQSEGIYRLYGYKWFTSATDADVSLTLGRVIDQEGKATKV